MQHALPVTSADAQKRAQEVPGLYAAAGSSPVHIPSISASHLHLGPSFPVFRPNFVFISDLSQALPFCDDSARNALKAVGQNPSCPSVGPAALQGNRKQRSQHAPRQEQYGVLLTEEWGGTELCSADQGERRDLLEGGHLL